jgi:hypothetical protein
MTHGVGGWMAGLSGVALVGGTVLSAIRTFVLPRSSRSIVTVAVFRVVKRVFDLVARGPYLRRDRILALYVPIALLALAGSWLALVIGGFGALFWAIGYGSFPDSLWVAGSSVLTLGSADLATGGHRALAFAAAAMGLGLVALLISFLPSLYGAFSRRETLVALLEVRAGVPPSAVEMLIRFERIGWTAELDEEWRRWEEWFADIEESHTSFPMLSFLRSPTPDRSWVVAAGTILDAASLSLATVDRQPEPMAALCIRAGYTALRQMARAFSIGFDPDPEPDDPISVTRAEFDGVLDRMAAAGVPIRPDRDAAWRDFAGWRVNYDTVVLALAQMVVAPLSPWVSDRSPLNGRRSRAEWRRLTSGFGSED